MDFDQFRQQHPNGTRIADPLLVGHGETATTMYQCVSLIKGYWTQCYGITVDWPGNAIDLWQHTNAVILSKFYKTQTNDVNKGDIVVLNGLAGNPYGHVGIATGAQNGNQVEMLEQNGQTGGGTGTGGDAIRTRFIDRSRIAGLLRPIVLAAAPAPAPPAPAATVHPYTALEIIPRKLQVTRDSHIWGMNYDNWTAMSAHPISTIKNGDIIEMHQVITHNLGAQYYVPSGMAEAGINTADLKEYSPPPAGAFTVPSGRTQTIEYELHGYNTGTQAAYAYESGHYDVNLKQMIPAGTYPVFNVYTNKEYLVNIKSTDGQYWAYVDLREQDAIKKKQAVDEANAAAATQKAADEAREAVEAQKAAIMARYANETSVTPPPPTPTPTTTTVLADWRTTYKAFKGDDGKPDAKLYYITENVSVHDLESKHADQPGKKYAKIWISGTFIKDNVVYARPQVAAERCLWYGIALKDFLVQADTDTTIDTQFIQTPHSLTLSDRTTELRAFVEAYSAPLIKSIEGVFKRKQKTK